MEKEILKNLSEKLGKEGFKISFGNSLAGVSWRFDLLAEDNEKIWAIEVRKNDSVNSIFLEKISNLKRLKKPLYIFILFEKFPKKTTISLLKNYGIGVLATKGKEFFVISSSKSFSKKIPKKKVIKKRKKVKQMDTIFVFVSSKQNEKINGKILKERTKICNIIKEFNRDHPIPIFPKLIEWSFDGDARFKRKISKGIKESKIFICSLQEYYGPYVEYEIEKANELIKDRKLILIFVKNAKPENVDKEQIYLIEKIQKEMKIQTIPYSNNSEFESLSKNYLMKMISHLYKKKKMKSPFEFS